MEPAEGCLAEGENTGRGHFVLPSLPPTRREFCLVPLHSQGGSWCKDEYVWVTLRWSTHSPNSLCGKPVLPSILNSMLQGRYWQHRATGAFLLQIKKLILSELYHECRKKLQILCHTQMHLLTALCLVLSMDFSDPPATHYPFYNTLPQILIHNQTSYPILVTKIT